MCYNDNDNEQPFCVFATKSIAGAVRNYNEDRIAYEVNMKYIKYYLRKREFLNFILI